MAKILINTYAIKYGFTNKKFIETVCQVFKIKL